MYSFLMFAAVLPTSAGPVTNRSSPSLMSACLLLVLITCGLEIILVCPNVFNICSKLHVLPLLSLNSMIVLPTGVIGGTLTLGAPLGRPVISSADVTARSKSLFILVGFLILFTMGLVYCEDCILIPLGSEILSGLRVCVPIAFSSSMVKSAISTSISTCGCGLSSSSITFFITCQSLLRAATTSLLPPEY